VIALNDRITLREPACDFAGGRAMQEHNGAQEHNGDSATIR
jgi:hypothetical protein